MVNNMESRLAFLFYLLYLLLFFILYFVYSWIFFVFEDYLLKMIQELRLDEIVIYPFDSCPNLELWYDQLKHNICNIMM